MENVLEKLDNLKNVLDSTSEVDNIRKLNHEISNNKELLALIDRYKMMPSDVLKKEITSNPFFEEYKKCENDLNFLILEINRKLKEITDKDKCSL